MGLDMFMTRHNGDFSEEFAYWRKVNQIHKYFTDKYNEEVEGSYLITVEDLQELLSLCERVLLDKSQASTLLPTQTGFFFGSQEYDEYYFRGIEHTMGVCRDALDLIEEDPSNEFEYSSWW